jgi:hypothetical protein
MHTCKGHGQYYRPPSSERKIKPLGITGGLFLVKCQTYPATCDNTKHQTIDFCDRIYFAVECRKEQEDKLMRI